MRNAEFSNRLAAVLLLLLLYPSVGLARGDGWLIDVQGPIGPAVADHMERALDQAVDAGAPLVILRIDTPGGLDSSMRLMIKALLASEIPVVAWVAPSGARAASAGTYLLYAAHVAAMASGTNLGAATPIQIGSPSLPKMPSGEDDEQPTVADDSTAMKKKIVNDAVAYIQSLAQLRGRNAQWAELAVREGASLSAEDALQREVIELLADSIPALLEQLHGRSVAMGDGAVTLQTEGLAIYQHPMDWRSKFLAIITDPNIAYVLMLVGIYGLIIEFYNPGVGFAGITGAVCLLLALYAFQVLPISYAGLGLILLGIVLIIVEAMAPSFGVFGLGGIVAFVVGSIMLMDTELPGYQIALPIIVAFTLFTGALLLIALRLIVAARRQAVVMGPEHLLGAIAEVEVLRNGEAFVRLDGELWQTLSDQPLSESDHVTVEGSDGPILKVTKCTEE
jgi:membrane-bound serine protease (ClpP class)